MAKNKTIWTGAGVNEFIDSFVENDQKKDDSYRLVESMGAWTGFEPRMWGPTIIGFGRYHYKYASGHEGDAPVIGFSPRKAAISLYVFSPTEKSRRLLEDLGKFRMGKSCIYVKRLSDINIQVLEELCRESIRYLQQMYGHNPPE